MSHHYGGQQFLGSSNANKLLLDFGQLVLLEHSIKDYWAITILTSKHQTICLFSNVLFNSITINITHISTRYTVVTHFVGLIGTITYLNSLINYDIVIQYIQAMRYIYSIKGREIIRKIMRELLLSFIYNI